MNISKNLKLIQIHQQGNALDKPLRDDATIPQLPSAALQDHTASVRLRTSNTRLYRYRQVSTGRRRHTRLKISIVKI